MKIAIIAPPVTTVPPLGQGGLETILSYKIDALAKQHQVHLFGAGKNQKANITYHQILPKTITEMVFDPEQTEASRKIRLEASYMIRVLQEIVKLQDEFDVIFNHTRATELMPALVLDSLRVPIFNVFHLPILPEHGEILAANEKILAISISKDQIADWPNLKNFKGTVHNGIDPEKYPFSDTAEDYLLWVGTIGAHKNPLEAIKAAKALNKKIILMGKIRDQDYFDQAVAPEIKKEKVEYLGELNYEKKLPYFQKAAVGLFPTKIREACPVTPIELTMCGTPVVAYPLGGTKELIKNGVNGFLVNNLNGLITKTKEALTLDRFRCHQFAKDNFSSAIMAKKYLEIYQIYKGKS